MTTTANIITLGFNGIERGADGYCGRGGAALFTVQMKQDDGSYVAVAKCHDADDGTRWARRQMKRNGGGEYMVIKGRKTFWLTSDDAKRSA